LLRARHGGKVASVIEVAEDPAPGERPRVMEPCDVALLDSRDSFTFNLAHAFAELGARVRVIAADGVGAEDVLASSPKVVCIGPGPRGPDDLPALVSLCRALSGRVPLFGVCLGMQALAIAHGGRVGRAFEPVHGKRSAVWHEGRSLFAGLPSPLPVMRYHSLVVTRAPEGWEVLARCDRGQPMAVEHAASRISAVQFHPESIGTSGGLHVLAAALSAAALPIDDVVYRGGSIPPPPAGQEASHASS
jgi:anthranilate synthase/aminodeoxychorismate synthase-like glutamine amidotransferase